MKKSATRGEGDRQRHAFDGRGGANTKETHNTLGDRTVEKKEKLREKRNNTKEGKYKKMKRLWMNRRARPQKITV